MEEVHRCKCKVKEARYKISHTVWLHLCKVQKKREWIHVRSQDCGYSGPGTGVTGRGPEGTSGIGVMFYF